MKIRFKKQDDPIWFRLVDICPDRLNIEEFVKDLGGKLFTKDDDFVERYVGIEFETEAHHTWFLLKI